MKYTLEELRRARDFYKNSPDGQWDHVAVWALQRVIWIRKLDEAALRGEPKPDRATDPDAPGGET